MSSSPSEKDSELNVLHDLLAVDGDIDADDDTREESALRSSGGGRPLTTSTRHIPISRKVANDRLAAGSSQRQKQQFTDKSRSRLESQPNRLASRGTTQNSRQNSHTAPSATSNKDTMKSSTASGTSRSNKQSSESADVRLKQLESERRQLERENEKKKRELEELKRQEMMIEVASRKGDFNNAHAEKTKRSAEFNDNRSKRQKTGDTSEIQIKHVSPVRSLNDGSVAEEAADDLEEDHEGGDDEDDDEDDGNEESENSYSEVTVVSVKTLDDDSERGSVEEESGDEDDSGSSDGDNLSEETEESDDDGSDPKDSAASDVSKKRRVAISPIRWKESDAADARKSDHQQSSKDRPNVSREGRRSRSASRQSSSRSSDKLLKYIFLDTKYFLIKSGNHENVALAQARGVWSTPPSNELRLNQAFRTCSNVILIFSVKESGKFQGYARIATESDRNHPPIRWVLPQGLTARTLSSVFTLDWINRNELDFKETMHLCNKLNENNPIRIGRDGQPIDPVSGEALCRLFRTDRRIDLHAIALKSREAMEKRGIDPHEEYKRTEATRRKVKLEQEKRRAARRAERRNDERTKEPARRRSFPDDLAHHDRKPRRSSTSMDRGQRNSLPKGSFIADRLRRLSDTSVRLPAERFGRDDRPTGLAPSDRKPLRRDDVRHKRTSAEGIRRRVLHMDMSPDRRLAGNGVRKGFVSASPQPRSHLDREFGRRSPPPLQSSRRSRIPNLLQMPPLPPPPPTIQSFTEMFHDSRPHPAAFADYRRPLPPRRRSRERFGNGPMRPPARPSSSDVSWDRRRPGRFC